MTDIDFFHPASPTWVAIGGEAPEPLREQFPQLSWDKIAVREQTLPFYPGTRLLMMRGADWAPPNLFIYALQKDDEVHLLNGKSPPIHAFNAAGHLELTQDNIVAYLKFFCFFVRGDEGPFYLIGHLGASYLINGLRQGTTDEALNKFRGDFELRYQSPRTFGKSPDGKWRCSGTIMYSNAIFVADFQVQSGGMVEMLNDTPVLADLPAKIVAPLMPETEGGATLH
ncbi:MAG: hypothetical protein ABS75_10445 [Pelagibacterium sp. SCN 63-23]|nr:MAG: hypothetical protein ABS75_10445 [Pelagibacterium sp. SCN 63-23]